MTLEQLHSNDALRHREFPITRDKIFLAHAGVCPLPQRVADAIQRHAAQCTLQDQDAAGAYELLQQTRETAARLLQVKPEEIAFVGPTTLALNYVARGLHFRRNDNVVIYFEDYPSNVYPWLALADRGVQVRFLNIRDLGRVQVRDVLGQIDEQTRLVALASCHFLSGYRIDLAGLGRALNERGILFCADAIQTVGAFPTPLTHIDFMAADAHKWLLGPCAAGILYVRESAQPHLRPSVVGWNNVRCPNFVAQEEMVFRSNARRYEAGTHNLVGLAGLRAAMEIILEIGVETIAAELLRKRAWVVPALQAKGYTVLAAAERPEHSSGIISFFRSGLDMAALHQRLESGRVITSFRADRSGQAYIRVSPHFYNTDAELRQLLDLV